MADVLTYVLHYEGELNKNSLGAVSEGAARASEIGGECHALVLGSKEELSDELCQSLGAYGASKVFRAEGAEGLAQPVVDAMAKVKAENFELADALAQAFGGNSAVAATRAVVDAGWYPYAAQIGQTGKTVAPKLYLAAGISGAIQHKVGMQSSENIVAINKDANAPIFEFSGLGIVGDLNKILPKLTEAVKTKKGG